MKTPLIALTTLLAFLSAPINAFAGAFHTEIVRARLIIVVPANKALTVLTFSQPADLQGHRGFLSIAKGLDSAGPLLLSYPVNNGSFPPFVKDLVIAGPTSVYVDPPDVDGGVAFLCYKLQAN